MHFTPGAGAKAEEELGIEHSLAKFLSNAGHS